MLFQRVRLYERFIRDLEPALAGLLAAAAAAGEMRADITPDDLLRAVARLCTTRQAADPEQARRMVALLVDGLRYGARPPPSPPA